MKKLLCLFILFFLLITPSLLGDGMPLPPPKEETFDFSAVKEKQQYATVEVLSNYYQRTNMFLSLTSLSGEKKNVTLVVPFESAPNKFEANRLSSEEFLKKYDFSEVKNLSEKQSFSGVASATSPKLRDYLSNYLASVILSPLYRIMGKAPGGPDYYPAFGSMREGAGKKLPSGVEKIAEYKFEGGELKLFNVSSGQTLDDFLEKSYQLQPPENVKKAIDKYGRHYIAVINLKVEPISDVSLLKRYAPKALQDLKDYINAHPDLTLKCREPRYHQQNKKCTARSQLKEELSGIIDDALKESEKNNIGEEPINAGEIEKLGSKLDAEIPGWWTWSSDELTNYVKAERNEDGIVNLGVDVQIGSSSLYETISSGRYGARFRTKEYNKQMSPYLEIRTSEGSFEEKVIGDTFIEAGQNSYKNYGFDEEMGATEAGDASLLKFDLSEINGKIEDVDLNLYSHEDWWASSRPVAIWSVPGNWEEGSVDWNSRPGGNKVSPSSGKDKIEKQILDYAEAIYSRKSKGVELSLTLPMKNNKIFYPLGTGTAWSVPIEDTKILVKMSKDLKVSLPSAKYNAIGNNERYYLYEYKNWNPNFDVEGKVSKSGIFTRIKDSWKMLMSSFYKNSGKVAAAWFLILIFCVGGTLYWFDYLDKKDMKYLIPGVIISPLISVWAFLMLAFGLQTEPDSEKIKEKGMKLLKFFIGVGIIYGIVAFIAFVLGG